MITESIILYQQLVFSAVSQSAQNGPYGQELLLVGSKNGDTKGTIERQLIFEIIHG